VRAPGNRPVPHAPVPRTKRGCLSSGAPESLRIERQLHRRRLVLPAKIDNWSLTSLQQRLVKTGGRLVKHARYYWLMLAEDHLTRRLFGSMVHRIQALPAPAG